MNVLPLIILLVGNGCVVARDMAHPSFATIRGLYNFNTMLLPAYLALYGVGVMVFRKQRCRCNGRWRRRAWPWFAIAVGLVALRVYATHIEPTRCRLRTVRIETAKLTQPLRVLHISDLQVDEVGRYEARVFSRVRKLDPDLILHTGDLLQPQPPATLESELPKLCVLLQSLDPPLGMFSVYGDTDWRLIQHAQQDVGGMRFLRDEALCINTPGGRLNVRGLSLNESAYGEQALAQIDRWLESATDEITILMGHRPDYAMAAQTRDIDLCLAGHTHGGQVRVPLIGPLFTSSDVPNDWARGYREIGRTRLNVSAGAGSEHKDDVPPLRFMCPTEMTLIEFVPKGETNNEE